MARTASVLDEIVMRNPHVALALCRILMRRIIVSNERSESFGMDSIPRRLARALLCFSDRLGKPEDPDWISIPPFSHVYSESTLAGIASRSRCA